MVKIKNKEEVSNEMADLLDFNDQNIEVDEPIENDTFSREQMIAEEMQIKEVEEEKEELKHFDIIEKIRNIEKYFNEIDDYFDNISDIKAKTMNILVIYYIIWK